jgi:membrane-associated progesterone receptor component
MYSNFSGRDASRGMAKHSFDKDMLTDLDKPIDTLDDLTAEERQALKEWEEFFSNKYTCIGRLMNEK